VLAHQPDLVFIEFCVNDSETDPLRIRRFLEGIMRRIRRHNPRTAIGLLSIVMRSHLAFYERGELPLSVAAHEAIARHYGRMRRDSGRTVSSWDEFAPHFARSLRAPGRRSRTWETQAHTADFAR